MQKFRSWPLIFILGPPPTKVLQIDKWKPKKEIYLTVPLSQLFQEHQDKPLSKPKHQQTIHKSR